MNDLTFICTQRIDTRMVTTYTFRQTTWYTSSGAGDDLTTEDVHWSTPGAEPFEDDGATFTLAADEDEYEVGGHYAFAPTRLSTPDGEEGE